MARVGHDLWMGQFGDETTLLLVKILRVMEGQRFLRLRENV